MKTKDKFFICPQYHPLSAVCVIAVILQFGMLAGYAQTGTYLFTGSETTLTLNPGTYDITTYGAQGAAASQVGWGIGGLGAEMSARFSFSGLTTLTLLVGGTGSGYSQQPYAGGGGGGGFVVKGSTPLVIAGGGGFFTAGGWGNTCPVPPDQSFLGGGGGGAGYGYGGNGGYGGGGGGGSIIDSSAIMLLAEVSGVASPDGSRNGEIIITAVPEPTTLALAGLSGLCFLLFRRQRK